MSKMDSLDESRLRLSGSSEYGENSSNYRWQVRYMIDLLNTPTEENSDVELTESANGIRHLIPESSSEECHLTSFHKVEADELNGDSQKLMKTSAKTYKDGHSYRENKTLEILKDQNFRVEKDCKERFARQVENHAREMLIARENFSYLLKNAYLERDRI